MFLSFFVFLLLCLPVRAADEYGYERTADRAGLKTFGENPAAIVGRVIGAGLAMVGVLFFILTLYGGILWMTAHGNEEQTKKAKDAIIAAVIGIIVVVAAYALTRFVFQSLGLR